MDRVQLKHVAAAAGVSIATASTAINHPGQVSAAARIAVQNAVRTVGYVPDAAARRLRAGRSRLLGVLTDGICDLLDDHFLRSAADEAEACGFDVLTVNGAASARRERGLRLFERFRVEGVVVLSRQVDPSLLDRLRGRGIATVQIGDPDDSIPSIGVREADVGRLAAHRLLEGGCTRLLFAYGSLDSGAVRARLDGFRSEAAMTGVPLEVFHLSGTAVHDGRELGAWLARGSLERHDGIFAGTDELAIGVIRGLIAAGLQVPRDVAVIGYGDLAIADTALVPLTSIRHPGDRLGRVAVRTLVARIRNEAEAPPERFDPVLVQRASTR